MTTILRWKLAILYFVLFSMNALATSIVASLTGTNWADLHGTQKFIIVSAIIANWTATVMAFLSKAAHTPDQIIPDK